MAKIMKPQEYKYCMTIGQLKELVRDLPEKNELGEPYEVWMTTGVGLSSEVSNVWPLNKRETGQDIIFGCRQHERK